MKALVDSNKLYGNFVFAAIFLEVSRSWEDQSELRILPSTLFSINCAVSFHLLFCVCVFNQDLFESKWSFSCANTA